MANRPALENMLWAKTASRQRDETGYHSLICHLIDVSQVTLAMWERVLSGGTRKRISSACGLPEEATGRWIAYLAGLHDIGKACPSFQQQFPPAYRALHEQLPFQNAPDNKNAPHGTVSAIVLTNLLFNQHSFARRAALRIATAVGGHHGMFPSSREQQSLESQIGRGPWLEQRANLAALLSSSLAISPALMPSEMDQATAMWLAGIVSVADWIGSNTDFFKIEHDMSSPVPVDIDAYVSLSRDRANEALMKLGWLGWEAGDEQLEWNKLFGFSPRPLQEEAIDLAPQIDGPGLVIVEAPMGEGKTEAALYLTDYWSVSNGQQGAYIALPTMATSNQMFGRVRDFLEHRYLEAIINLQLLHGQAALSKEFEKLLEEGRFEPDNIDHSESGAVVAQQWFSYRKRGLLAPFGVGTIDQALLAVLQTRHVFVRLFGLSNKTLIIDEVHAYDTYMTNLLERLLEWCAALDTSIILLSATLPDSHRRQLAAAYARGLGNADPDVLPAASYPRLSWMSRAGSGATSIETSAQVKKSIAVEWVSGEIADDSAEAFPLGDQLREALKDGGCAAVICNTVKRAQQMYEALQDYFEPDELDLLHARFLFKDRDAREKRALQRYGKPCSEVVMEDGTKKKVERPERSVIVATQVIEQSLDLDFDLMVTDFAPIDLMLQRAGRLHRHDRGDSRPAGLKHSRLWITELDIQDDGVPRFESGAAYIYDEHILLRSWLVLEDRKARDKTSIDLPDDVEELIEGVYADQAVSALSPAIEAYWQSSREELDERVKDETREANNRWLKEPSFSGPIWRLVQNAREEDAPELHPAHQALTRLIGPSVQVTMLFGNEHRAFFDLEQSKPVDYDETSDRETVRRLLMRSVTLTNRGIVMDLLEIDPPPSWQKSALLRQHRLLLLDRTGTCQVGKSTIVLDPELGVRIE